MPSEKDLAFHAAHMLNYIKYGHSKQTTKEQIKSKSTIECMPRNLKWNATNQQLKILTRKQQHIHALTSAQCITYGNTLHYQHTCA